MLLVLAYDFGNGFSAAAGYQFTETGIAMTEEGLILMVKRLLTQLITTVFLLLTQTVEDGTNDNDTYTALNGYYSFDNGLNISAGYEIGDLDGAAATADENQATSLESMEKLDQEN